jgi:hypothetical protein
LILNKESKTLSTIGYNITLAMLNDEDKVVGRRKLKEWTNSQKMEKKDN